jgi:hypothetical protein
VVLSLICVRCAPRVRYHERTLRNRFALARTYPPLLLAPITSADVVAAQ